MDDQQASRTKIAAAVSLLITAPNVLSKQHIAALEAALLTGGEALGAAEAIATHPMYTVRVANAQNTDGSKHAVSGSDVTTFYFLAGTLLASLQRWPSAADAFASVSGTATWSTPQAATASRQSMDVVSAAMC